MHAVLSHGPPPVQTNPELLVASSHSPKSYFFQIFFHMNLFMDVGYEDEMCLEQTAVSNGDTCFFLFRS